MRTFAYTITFLILMAGCTMSSQENISKQSLENLTELQPPTDQPHESSKVYIDSVRKAPVDDHLLLIVHGSFPDGCSYLDSAEHRAGDTGTLHLELRAWRNPEQMCTQALTPFTFLYDEISKEELSDYSEIIINDSTYEL